MNEQMDTGETVESLKPLRTENRPPLSAKPADQVEARNTTRAPKSPGIPNMPRKVAVDDDDDESFLQRHRLGLIVGAIVLIGAGWAAFHRPSGKSQPERKAPEPVMVRIQAPPPPPPPPPPKIQPPPPKDEKQPEQTAMAVPEAKPQDAKPKPVDKPPEGLGTNIKGPGAGLAGLSGGAGNGMLGGTGTGPGGGGSMAAWYAGQVQAKIADELRRQDKTRKASIKGLKFSVLVDATGRITGATLLASTGDRSLDEAIKGAMLAGIQLQEPPPGGKPMTITMMLNARRPN